MSNAFKSLIKQASRNLLFEFGTKAYTLGAGLGLVQIEFGPPTGWQPRLVWFGSTGQVPSTNSLVEFG